jgi:hypothetical protein
VTINQLSATVPQRPGAMAKSLEASPMKSVAEELVFVRKAFRECIDVYTSRIEGQIAQIREKVLEQTKNPKQSAAHIRDLRDMITLCRTLDIKPDKGRRKDLKKIDSLVDELLILVQNW